MLARIAIMDSRTGILWCIMTGAYDLWDTAILSYRTWSVLRFGGEFQGQTELRDRAKSFHHEQAPHMAFPVMDSRSVRPWCQLAHLEVDRSLSVAGAFEKWMGYVASPDCRMLRNLSQFSSGVLYV